VYIFVKKTLNIASFWAFAERVHAVMSNTNLVCGMAPELELVFNVMDLGISKITFDHKCARLMTYTTVSCSAQAVTFNVILRRNQ